MRRKIKALSIALVGVTAALVAVMAAVSLDLRRQLDLVATAKTDNIHWDVLQTEAEYLRLQTALIEAELRGGPALFQLRHRFDIFYSRVLLIEQGNIFERLRDVPSFEKNLSHLRDYLNETVPLIDGADAKLIAEIPRLEETTAALNKEVRALVVTGVTHFATVTDNQREAVADTLKRLGALAGVLILVLMGANVMLWLLLRRVQSDAEQIQAAQSHLSAIVSSSLDAVLVVDRIGGIVDYNGAAEAMFGYPREDILGCPLAKTLIGPTKKRQELTWIELKQNTAETGQARVELEAQRLDGALFPAEIAISRAELPHGPLYVLFVRDISEQRAAEADLRAARDTALQNERARARFMAVMSHEMRNPLNGIIGSLEL
ncbi:MAG: PAS domain S-box protein, partial [Mangrovicoccus sp.]